MALDSRLDYCILLFYNIPEKDIARLGLERVQNCLARVVTKAPCFSRSPQDKKNSIIGIQMVVYLQTVDFSSEWCSVYGKKHRFRHQSVTLSDRVSLFFTDSCLFFK